MSKRSKVVESTREELKPFVDDDKHFSLVR